MTDKRSVVFGLVCVALAWSAMGQGDDGKTRIETPGWTTGGAEVLAALEAAAESGDPIALIRCGNQYARAGQPRCVHTWAQMRAFGPFTRVRVPTGWQNAALTTLREQRGQGTIAGPDLWIASSDLKLLAYAAYTSDAQEAQRRAQAAIAQAAELQRWRERAERTLEGADRQAAGGRFGQAWRSVETLAAQDAAVYRALRELDVVEAEESAGRGGGTRPPRGPSGEDLFGPDFVPDGEAAPEPEPEPEAEAPSGPGPGHFFDDLAGERRAAYEALAEERLVEARAALDVGDVRAARRLLLPMTQSNLEWPVIDRAKELLRASRE